MKGGAARFRLSSFTTFPTMKKILLSLLFALMALVLVCGSRAEARVAVSINVGCPRVCMPCPPRYYCPPPCPPRYCAPCPPPYYAPPAHCHVHRPHIHYSYPNHGGHRAPHRAPRGHAHRR